MTRFNKQPGNTQRPQPQRRANRFGFGPFNRPGHFPNQIRNAIRIQTG